MRCRFVRFKIIGAFMYIKFNTRGFFVFYPFFFKKKFSMCKRTGAWMVMEQKWSGKANERY